MLWPWSSLEKGLGSFPKNKKMNSLQKQPTFLLNGEVIWQASDSPLSKELHIYSNKVLLK